MHELDITVEMIKAIKEICKKNNITRPKQAHIELGELSTYKADQIQYYFSILKKEEDLSELVIKIKSIKGKMKCETCKKEGMIHDITEILCKKCASNKIKIIQGKDINIKSIEY